jgi:hypothetical protein
VLFKSHFLPIMVQSTCAWILQMRMLESVGTWIKRMGVCILDAIKGFLIEIALSLSYNTKRAPMTMKLNEKCEALLFLTLSRTTNRDSKKGNAK